jgi:hypothetical protein
MTTSTTTPTKTKASKAVAGAIVTAVGGLAVGIEQAIPDPTVKLVCTIVTLAATAVGNVLAVYYTVNDPVD